MLITFTHAYRPCWLANAIELCTKQTRNRVCVTHPLAVYKTARCSLILLTKTLVRTRYVQFTYFTGRVYCPLLHIFIDGEYRDSCHGPKLDLHLRPLAIRLAYSHVPILGVILGVKIVYKTCTKES